MNRTLEFRVVWRWKTDRYRDEFTEERTRTYKTEAGARKLIAKLTSNGGEYEHVSDTEPTRYDDGYHRETWYLDFARLDARDVSPWTPAP